MLITALLDRFANASEQEPVAGQPNVVIIVTDDQGFGELGVTGNPVIRTPNLDRLARASVSLTNFHVMPVCSPTRACLLTGRYNYRSGVVDTYRGRSLMDPRETTLGEMLGAAGYRTGIFGKWHLGDNYPMRAMDKGFQETLVLNGGGLSQPGDPPDPVDERGAYFNAMLRKNGVWTKTDGYVSDVITAAAMRYIEQNRDRPFFVYLPFNCPHAPHQVPDDYRQHYSPADFLPGRYPAVGHPMAPRRNVNDLARVYGMIENIDENVGLLLAKLDQLKLADNTIVVLFSDNGCQRHNGYNAGFQGWKGTPYEGGIHQFCFIRWPNHLPVGRKVDRISACFDLAPTLLDLCGVKKPDGVKFDGVSLAPLLRGQAEAWPERTLFFQWHRGNIPQRYRAMAVRSQNWKLVQPLGAGESWDGKTSFQLYDMAHDSLEMHDLAAQMPERVAKLKKEYDGWFSDVTAGRDYGSPPSIYLNTKHENPVLLTRQDFRAPDAGGQPETAGHWEVNVVGNARVDIQVRFEPLLSDGEARLSIGALKQSQAVEKGVTETVFKSLRLPLGQGRLQVTIDAKDSSQAARYIEVRQTSERD